MSPLLRTYSDSPTELNLNDTGEHKLCTITVPLPLSPEWDKIDNFGLPASEQKFKRQEYPSRLRTLEERCNTVNELWEELDANKDYYKYEIWWIRLQWYRLFNGYWFFNNGVPTYIDGWHYVYLNFWELDIGLPDYRERDYKFFHFARFCYNDPYCFGFNYPKHRREGATSKASCIHYFSIIIRRRANGGIQSMTDDHSEAVFLQHVVEPWKRLPFFFKPMHEGTSDPKGKLSFKPPAVHITAKGTSISYVEGLSSTITFKERGVKAYDTWKLHFHHDDEVGKTKDVDVNERWRVVKRCLSQGNGKIIHGFTIKTSTVGDMVKGGGRNFYKLCMDSNYSDRDDNNQTTSGLYVLFIPGYEGLDGFIDEFGNSVIETPEKTVIGIDGQVITTGSYEFINNTRKGLIKRKDWAGLSEEKRLIPIKFSECFHDQGRDTGFNINIIEERLDELLDDSTGEPRAVRGNFEWGSGADSFVVFKKDEPGTKNPGRFLVSLLLNPGEHNQKYQKNNKYHPSNPYRFLAVADPYKFRKTEGTRKSSGGGVVFYLRDENIDTNTTDIGNWESYRFVVTYNYRLDTSELHAEDMLMMCVYYGAMMFPEINIDKIWTHFEDRGYGGYLLHAYDMKQKRFRITPGFSKSPLTQLKGYNGLRDYINVHAKRERHNDLLEECKDIEGIEYMTDYDVFSSAAGVFVGIDTLMLMKHKKAFTVNDTSPRLVKNIMPRYSQWKTFKN